MSLPELTEGWGYALDGFHSNVCYGPGLWPIYARERPRSPKKAPVAGVRISPDVAVYSWGPEYVLLGVDDDGIGATATLHLNRVYDFENRVEIKIDLRDLSFEIVGDVREHGAEATEKAEKIVALIRTWQAERDKGRSRPIDTCEIKRPAGV